MDAWPFIDAPHNLKNDLIGNGFGSQLEKRVLSYILANFGDYYLTPRGGLTNPRKRQMARRGIKVTNNFYFVKISEMIKGIDIAAGRKINKVVGIRRIDRKREKSIKPKIRRK